MSRFLRRSNQSGDALDVREMALDGIGQIGDCALIQLPMVCATATARCETGDAFLVETCIRRRAHRGAEPRRAIAVASLAAW
jgi:hypothetical protein